MTLHLPTTVATIRNELRNGDHAALSHLMEFDCPVTVHEDGTVTDGPADLYAPDLMGDELSSDAWTMLDGYSGQYGYSGPVMHNSEFIGGGMARNILDTPGTYVAVASYYLPTCDQCDADVIEGPDGEPHHASDVGPEYIDTGADADHLPDSADTTAEGWAVARLNDPAA